mmetsp:Transcript_46392/g.100771  ORF Transcript_46392/g.100771 Transcript_46392/m.100771 type:complete len:252 (+) Transcript_46392:398-1153(+)
MRRPWHEVRHDSYLDFVGQVDTAINHRDSRCAGRATKVRVQRGILRSEARGWLAEAQAPESRPSGHVREVQPSAQALHARVQSDGGRDASRWHEHHRASLRPRPVRRCAGREQGQGLPGSDEAVGLQRSASVARPLAFPSQPWLLWRRRRQHVRHARLPRQKDARQYGQQKAHDDEPDGLQGGPEAQLDLPRWQHPRSSWRLCADQGRGAQEPSRGARHPPTLQAPRHAAVSNLSRRRRGRRRSERARAQG